MRALFLVALIVVASLAFTPDATVNWTPCVLRTRTVRKAQTMEEKRNEMREKLKRAHELELFDSHETEQTVVDMAECATIKCMEKIVITF